MSRLRNPWVVGVVLLAIGLAICILSFIPVTHLVPYERETQEQVETVQQDGTVRAWYDYYSNSFTFAAGDVVTIKAQSQDGTLYCAVTDILGNQIGGQSGVSDINLNVTIPLNGMYTVTVGRYRTSSEVIFLTEASAYVYVKTRITQMGWVQDYQNVTTYPYRDIWPLGVTIMVLGVGICTVVFARNSARARCN
jgi:hypothetical protein